MGYIFRGSSIIYCFEHLFVIIEVNFLHRCLAFLKIGKLSLEHLPHEVSDPSEN